MKCALNSDGTIKEIGINILSEFYFELNGTEPFNLDNFQDYYLTNGRWLLKKIEWHEPDWKYRIFLTNDQLAYLTLHFFEMVLSFNTAPINPRYDFGDKVLVYLNTLTDEGRALLDSLSINIEKRD